jgi:hypothetical protein
MTGLRVEMGLVISEGQCGSVSVKDASVAAAQNDMERRLPVTHGRCPFSLDFRQLSLVRHAARLSVQRQLDATPIQSGDEIKILVSAFMGHPDGVSTNTAPSTSSANTRNTPRCSGNAHLTRSLCFNVGIVPASPVTGAPRRLVTVLVPRNA